MKRVQVTRRFDYRGKTSSGAVRVSYRPRDEPYDKVPEAHAEAIVAAGAGTLVEAAVAKAAPAGTGNGQK